MTDQELEQASRLKRAIAKLDRQIGQVETILFNLQAADSVNLFIDPDGANKSLRYSGAKPAPFKSYLERELTRLTERRDEKQAEFDAL